MRSSKKRSRSGPNRPRPIGNIVNRVFDSSGPEGKVRGTPQQIIEKYQTLARDAQLSNDRVAAENFLQHAEHYTRLLAEAQRELAAEQEARQQQQQQHYGNGGAHQGGRDRDMRDQDRQNERQTERQGERQAERFAERAVERAGEASAAAPLIDLGRDEGGLVDLPEGGGTATRRRTRDERPDQRAPRPEHEVRAIDADSPADGDTSSDASSDSGEAHATENAEPAAKAPARRPRRPRTAPAKAAGKAEIGETAPDAGASA